MGKALKTFLILNLLLSAAIVGFGVKIFMDREVIKARTVLLQNHAQQTARNLQWAQNPDWDEEDATARTAFSVPQPTDAAELPELERRLDELAQLASQRIGRLNVHHADLLQTRRQRDNLEEELADTQRTLANTEEALETTRNNLQSARNDLQQAQRDVDQLRNENTNLERNVASLEEELNRRNDRIATLEVDLETSREVLARAQDRVDRLEGRLARPGVDGDQGAWSGYTAEILAVNDQWQYVIIDRGEIDQLELYLEAIVHRGDEYLGRVSIVRIEETVSIAEIEAGTIPEGVQIQPGDTVFFN